MTQPNEAVPGWAKMAVCVAACVAVSLVGLMVGLATSAAPESEAPVAALVGVVAVAVAAGFWTMRAPSVSLWARLAVVLAAAQVGIAGAAWLLWQEIGAKLENAERGFPLLERLPAPAMALAGGGIVMVAALVAPRRRSGAPVWLHGVVVFSLAYLFFLSCWLPLVATEAPASHLIRMDVRPWIDRYVPIVLLPPAAVALAFAVVVEWRPRWLVQNLGGLTMAGAVFVTVAVGGAISARSEATPGAHHLYANFVHVLFSAAVFALLALVALAGSHARALIADGRDRRRGAPWTQEGVVVARPASATDDDGASARGTPVAHVDYHGFLGGLRSTVDRFILRTPAGDLPVPAGARLDAALPLSTQSAQRGDRAVVLADGDPVVVSGFVVGHGATAADGPFRGSSLPQPGPGGLVVSVPRERHATGTRDLLLLLWRPCVVFLVVAGLATLPGVLNSHAEWEPPDDIEEFSRDRR